MTARQYHDGSKHHFHRFATALGYLDWASQPHPFRSFGVPGLPLSFSLPDAARVSYDRLFQPPAGAAPLSAAAIGDVLRHALGLSAWKRFRDSRWALRVNPSSGNLHPTEAYLVAGPLPSVAPLPFVAHYAPDRHALEPRCRFDAAAWLTACGGRQDVWLVALTSIHWREAWKYGERAFRYCQHDLGHAAAALRLAAALVGWRAAILPQWSHATVAAVTGIERDDDFVEAEREEPGCIIAVSAGDLPVSLDDGRTLAEAIRRGDWSGRASQLSADHVEWTFIDEIARATADRGSRGTRPTPVTADGRPEMAGPGENGEVFLAAPPLRPADGACSDRGLDARQLILQRRSALAFDGQSSLAAEAFSTLLARVLPGPHPPWDALWWEARIHFLIFVHRVDGLAPGLYCLLRAAAALPRLRAASGRDFLWEHASDDLPLFLLARGDCRSLARRLSCDQAIAADGFFSLGMIADFEASLVEQGDAFYRHLFWEAGFVGQILYLEAEAAGARATGIGCFFDDPVHDVLGLTGHAFQSLYHFTVGMPVDDPRLTTEAPYPSLPPG
ncbi:MAG: SagB/ThcOx family dehydrogenase [Acidobacteriota bacterium]